MQRPASTPTSVSSLATYDLFIFKNIHFPTAAIFDLGVCVLVVGALLSIMASLGEEEG